MRIAHVTATFLPYYSGTGLVCLHNAVELARRGNDVTIFTSSFPPGEYIYPSEITVKRLPILFRFGNAPFLYDLLKIREFDVVHLHYPFIFGAELITVNSINRKIPFVLTYHNDLVGKGLRKHLFKTYLDITAAFVMKKAAKLITVNLAHAVHCQQKKLFSIHKKKVVEIPNGVDITIFRCEDDKAETRKQVNIAIDAQVILFVGVLDQAHHYRGLSYLIKVFAKIAQPQMRLIVVGDGDMRSVYQREVDDLNISRNVVFIGAIPNDQLPRIYRAADVLIIPSSEESFGITAIEAMACGIPVIAHDIPGISSVVTHNSDGLLTPLYDEEQLIIYTRELLGDNLRRKEMGQRGVEKVALKYTWPSIVQKLENVYKEII